MACYGSPGEKQNPCPSTNFHERFEVHKNRCSRQCYRKNLQDRFGWRAPFTNLKVALPLLKDYSRILYQN